MNSEYAEMAANGVIHAAQEQFIQLRDFMTEPSVMYRPAISVDGNKWCALYGDDLQCGVAGFGNSPYEAMCDFNKQWYAKLTNEKGQGDE